MSTTTTKTELSKQAHYQIEAMCLALQNAARSQDVECLPHLVQAMAIRIVELNGQLMFMLGGNAWDVADLEHTVFGFSEGVAA